MRRLFIAVFVLAITCVAFVFAQSQSQGGVKEGKVAISGENPVIRLSAKEGEPASTNVSFWRVIYSPVGIGHVCYVTSDLTGNGESADDLRLAFTDNEALLDYLNTQIMSAFDKTYAEKPMPSVKARFEKGTGDTRKEWHESFKSDKYSVELVWRDFDEPFLLDTPTGGERNPYGIASLFIPARSADVIINGKKATGQPFPQMRGQHQSSTAFLAFSETWLK
jgi:hypothetical protein